MKSIKLLFLSFVYLLFGCASKQINLPLQNEPVDSTNAPLAWFGEGNAPQYIKDAVAKGLQQYGLYNFFTESFSDQKIMDAIEIRLNYFEEKGKASIPALILNAEFLSYGELSTRVSLREESDADLFLPWKKSKEKEYRQQVLLMRFLEDVKTIRKSQQNMTLGQCN